MADLREIFKAYDVRGLVPEQLNESITKAMGTAFAQVVAIPDFVQESSPYARPTVLVAHDMRSSGAELAAAFGQGLSLAGVDAVQLGLCSTDELYFASGVSDAPGVMFTASHNPAGYNGAKFCRAGAKPISKATGLETIGILTEELLQNPLEVAERQVGAETSRNVLLPYAEFLRDLVDLSQIRPLRVVVDAGNGMAGLTTPAVLGTSVGLPTLPIELIPLYFELDGTFPNHEANPLDPKNLVDLQRAVLEHKADIGIAFDGDADRCFIVDENGDPVSPSTITVLVGLREAEREQDKGAAPTVIRNLITSQAVRELLEEAGIKTVRTRVGHSLIKKQMAEENAVFGGEHSAHYYFRDFFFADSGMLAAMHVLAQLGGQPLPLSEIASTYSPYFASGEINFPVDDVQKALLRVESVFFDRAQPLRDQGVEITQPIEADDLDGLTISHWDQEPRWWFNLRPSNTEPLMRLNAEADSQETLDAVVAKVSALLQS